jgi:hypothetical protein
MNNILQYCTKQSRFQEIDDFDAGVYCADTVRTAFRFAICADAQPL